MHISACVADIISNIFPKFRSNSAKKRAMLCVACSADLSVAFGVPISDVLFSYQEILLSTYFSRSFLCSLVGGASKHLIRWGRAG